MSAPQTLLAERYRLVRVIATGGMGVVWEAWDERLQRPVAIKELRTQHGVSDAEAEQAKNRAMREARITARLHHPHAVPVFDAVEHEGRPCLIMQYLPSTPLSAILRSRGRLEPHETARIGAEIASALAAAHKLKIVHRDVKPGNILVTEDGTAHISDFGISHALGDATLTRTGMVYGTPAYLAPEVARGAESTYASDVFSLGSTLYAALEGQPPFGADPNSIALLHRVASGNMTPPRHAGMLEPFLLDMLAPDPKKRPSMKAVASLLADLQRAAGSDKPTLPIPPVPPSAATAGGAGAAPPHGTGDEPASAGGPHLPWPFGRKHPAQEFAADGAVPTAAGTVAGAALGGVAGAAAGGGAAARAEPTETERMAQAAEQPTVASADAAPDAAADGDSTAGRAAGAAPAEGPGPDADAAAAPGPDAHVAGADLAGIFRTGADGAADPAPEPEPEPEPEADAEAASKAEEQPEPPPGPGSGSEPEQSSRAAPPARAHADATRDEEVSRPKSSTVAAAAGVGAAAAASAAATPRPATVSPTPPAAASGDPATTPTVTRGAPTVPSPTRSAPTVGAPTRQGPPAGGRPAGDSAVTAPIAVAGAGAPPGARRRRGLIAVLIAAAAVLAAIFLIPALIPGQLGEGADRAPGPVAAPESAEQAEPAPIESRAPADEETEEPPAEPEPTGEPAPPEETAEEPAEEPAEEEPAPDPVLRPEDAIRSYYALLPGNTDAGWQRLTADYQQGEAISRDYYEQFWGQFGAVSVSDVEPLGPDRVEATITYQYKDGGSESERRVFVFVQEDGILKIDDSGVV